MNIITSNSNNYIKEIKGLKDKKNRKNSGLFFFEGENLFHEGIKFLNYENIKDIVISEKYFSKNSDNLSKYKDKSILVSDSVFETLSDTENPQGILVVAKKFDENINKVIEKGNRFIVLEDIKDPGNFGTIVRTADAMGFDGVISSLECVDLYNPKTIRATMGSIFHIPVVYYNLNEAIVLLKNKAINVLATSLNANTAVFNRLISDKVAFIIGNEAKGVSTEIYKLADDVVKIPMLGKAESMNASIAASILMYESTRQKFC